jgi:hypothetical protein
MYYNTFYFVVILSKIVPTTVEQYTFTMENKTGVAKTKYERAFLIARYDLKDI